MSSGQRRGRSDTTTVTSHVSISLDGFAAGPRQSPQNPIGEGSGTMLGAGERLLENVGDPKLDPAEVIASPVVTHIRDRVVR